MRSAPSNTVLLLVASAALQALAFPVAGPLPPSRAGVAWFALVPLFWALLGTAGQPLRRAAVLGYGNGVLWYLATCYWVYSTMHTYGGLSPAFACLALVLMCLYLALYHALFAALLAWVARRSVALALLAAPFLWVAVELARARVTSFPWNLLGYAQVDNRLLTPLAPFAGVYGISFVLAAVNAAIAGLLLLPRQRRASAVAFAAALLAAGVQFAGTTRQAAATPGQQKAVLLQPNLDVGFGPQPSIETLAASASGLSQQAAQLDGAPTDVVLWPESPSPFQTDRVAFTEAATQLAHSLTAPVIAGAVGIEPVPGRPDQARVYNSAVLFLSGGGTVRYDKIHLVPFGEYTPYADLFRFASGLTQAVGTFNRGSSREPLAAAGHRFGTFLCYESIFGDEVRSFVQRGADVLVNLSDDGWYGDSSAPFQHLNMARMRAIENRRWLLRDTNTGITASIAPDGRVVETMPRHRRGAAVMHFDYLHGLTFYTRYGDVFAYSCTAIALCLVAGAARRRTQ